MISRYSVRTAAKALAQDAGPGSSATGVQLLFSDPGDYNLVLLQALRLFSKDRPNTRVVDHLVMAAGFRLALSGGSALASLAGADAWVLGASTLQQVYLPWDVAVQNAAPLDENVWRLTQDPGPTAVLELLDRSAAVGQTLRLVFSVPHTLSEAPSVIAAPTVAPTAAMATSGPGNVTTGTHRYVYTWVTAHGETAPSPPSAVLTVVNASVQGQVTVRVQASTDPGITAVRLYRTIAGDTGDRLLVLESAVTEPTYVLSGEPVGVSVPVGIDLTDNVADGSLGAAAPATNTAGGVNTVFEADGDALAVLTASLILQEAAVKSAQNTGNTGLPNDIVDRRTQSDIFRSRAKELRELYTSILGVGTARSELGPASAVRDLDMPERYGLGRLWHVPGVR